MIKLRLIDMSDFSRTELRSFATVKEAEHEGKQAIINENFDKFIIIIEKIYEIRESENLNLLEEVEQ